MAKRLANGLGMAPTLIAFGEVKSRALTVDKRLGRPVVRYGAAGESSPRLVSRW